MEKDLRDAYTALKLLRADLVKTRREKRALEASLMQLQTRGQTSESRETQHMQQEDANSHLVRLAAQYERKMAEMQRQQLDKKTEETPEVEDNQQQEESDELEKLALLNKLHSLTSTVEQQMQTMLAQQAAFGLQRGELETRLEETQHKLQREKTRLADALLEKQAAKENYEFLETQVEILKEEKSKVETKLAVHAQTSSILKQQLEEKDEERTKWENEQEEREMRLQLEHEQKMDALVGDLSARFRRENEAKEKELLDTHEREMMELQKRCRLLQLELSSEKEKKIQDQKESQERYTMTLRDLESNCAELDAQLAVAEADRNYHAKEHAAKLAEAQGRFDETRHELERSLVDVQTQLADNLLKIRDKEDAHERNATTVRDLEGSFAQVQEQLAATKVKMAEEAKIHEEKLAEAFRELRDQQVAHEQQVTTLRELDNRFAEVQAELAESETKRLTQAKEYAEEVTAASQLAAQHEKTARALKMEKTTLQQEVREARQTSKLTAEEFLKCQSVMEQKTQEHLQYLYQVQEQCESLETQLLSAEDHLNTLHGCAVDDSSALKAFHGLTSAEITALPPSKAWALLRSGINEIDGFLPHLQALLGATSDALGLCEKHVDTLPTLCERLQDKSGSEKGQFSILSISLNLLSFAVMLKTRINQEDKPVTPKIVQAFRRRLVDALAQWYECDPGDSDQAGHESMPTPTFTITSRETALILQNWTHDRTKQIGVRRWLARMEAYPGVPPLRGASSNRVLELPHEGCTLELEDMTPEVKDAFRLLLIPILKENRALHVRVFTRYTGDHERKQQAMDGGGDTHEEAEKVWAMRIHVQSAIAQHTRPHGSTRPAPLKLASSPRGPPSPLTPISPASSVSSSTSSTASSRLQIIQERLQYLHNNV